MILEQNFKANIFKRSSNSQYLFVQILKVLSPQVNDNSMSKCLCYCLERNKSNRNKYVRCLAECIAYLF